MGEPLRSRSGPAAESVDEPVRPDYGGAWVGGVLEALAAVVDETGGFPRGAADSWLPGAIAGAHRAVLLVVDGLGWQAFAEHASAMPVLSRLQGRAITTVAPSTTSAGLTSIATGCAPGDHGLLGYRIRVGGQILNVLSWSNGSRTPPDPEDTQRQRPFGGRALPVVTKSEFAKTGFTAAHLRGGAFTGWRTTSTLVEHCRRLVAGDQHLIYAYYDGLDKVAHEHGIIDGYYTAELTAVDRLVDDLLDALPDDTALVVTADHGQVQVGPGGAVALDAVGGLLGAMAGEGRFRSLWARPGASAELRAATTEHYGDLAWVFTRDQLFDEGWFAAPGSAISSTLRSRVGDIVLAARAPVIFVDPSQRHEHLMQSQHGSLTAAEMQVPLLAARGRR